jgi:hypothetical protein
MDRELGVSQRYLSQVKNSKCPASERLISKMGQNDKQKTSVSGRMAASSTLGEVSELADEHDLGSCAVKHGGSSPPFPTLLDLKPSILEKYQFVKLCCIGSLIF